MRVSMETLARLNMREGLKVEVCYEENDVWYKGTIETTRPPTKSKAIRHFGVRLVKDDFATPLTQNVLIRPVPPKHVEARIDIKEGSVVDAYHKEGWWTGFVIKEMEDNNCLVFFDSPPDIIQFDRKDLRPRLNWRLNRKLWSVPHPKTQLLRRLTEESKFSSGTMVEVSSEIAKKDLVWFPAMIIKEIEEDDESKYIVKFCNKPLNVTVDSKCVRPKPPPVLVHEFNLSDSVEAFGNSRWRKGIVKRVISQKCYMVSFESTKKQVKFDHSDLRFPMEWEDGVWKTSMMNGGNNPSLANESVSPVTSTPVIISTPLKHTEAETQGHTFPNKTLEPMTSQNCLGNDSTQDKGNPEKKTPSGGKRHNSVTLETRNVQTKEPQGSGNKMADALLNVKQEPTQGNTSNETTLTKGNESTRDKMPEEPNSEDNSRKRKRGELEHNSDRNETVQSSDRTPNMVMNVAAADDERTKAKDATMVLPFVKKSPVWKTYESMEVFKRVPQSPHFSPLFETKEDFREGFALGMMVTFSGVLEKVKDLKADVPISQLNSLKDSFTELEKHGFTVTAPISRINKLLALKDRQVNILNELKGFEEEMTYGSSKKRKAEQEIREIEGKIVEVKHKIFELQREEAALEKHKDVTYKKICLMESRARDLGIELEDVEFEFETLLSAPW